MTQWVLAGLAGVSVAEGATGLFMQKDHNTWMQQEAGKRRRLEEISVVAQGNLLEYAERLDHEQKEERQERRLGAEAQLYLENAEKSLERGALPAAVANMTEALVLLPKRDRAARFDCYSNRGLAYSEMGKYLMAIPDYTRCLDIKKFDFNSFNRRGTALLHLSRLLAHTGWPFLSKATQSLALEDFRSSVRLHPHQVIIKGKMVLLEKNYQVAIAYFDRILTVRPIRELYHLKALACAAQKDWDGEMECYTNLLEMTPDEERWKKEIARIYTLKGHRHHALNQKERAQECYRQAHEKDPTNCHFLRLKDKLRSADAQEALMIAELLLNGDEITPCNKEEGRALLEKVRRFRTKAGARACFLLGRSMLKDAGVAGLRILREAERRKDVDASYFLGYLASQKWEEDVSQAIVAERHLKKVLEAKLNRTNIPKRVAASTLLDFLYFHQKQYKKRDKPLHIIVDSAQEYQEITLSPLSCVEKVYKLRNKVAFFKAQINSQSGLFRQFTYDGILQKEPLDLLKKVIAHIPQSAATREENARSTQMAEFLSGVNRTTYICNAYFSLGLYLSEKNNEALQRKGIDYLRIVNMSKERVNNTMYVRTGFRLAQYELQEGNIAAAITLLTNCAQSGHGPSALQLGLLYKKGRPKRDRIPGIDPDHNLAIKYLKMAHLLQEDEAKEPLRELEGE